MVDAIIAADSSRKSAITSFEALRAEQNAFGKKVAKAKGEEKAALLAEVKELAVAVKTASAAADAAAAEQDALVRSMPNLVAVGVPEGGEDDFVVVKTVGAPREFPDFEPKDHLEIGELIGAIDMERAPRCPVHVFTSSRVWAPAWNWRCCRWPWIKPSKPVSRP